MQNPALGKEEPLQQYRLRLTGRGAALQKRIWVSTQRAGWAWARSVAWQQKKPKAEQPGGWQMCLSSLPRYSDGTGAPDPLLDPQCKKNMDTLEPVQQSPPRVLRVRALWGEVEGTGLVWPQKRWLYRRQPAPWWLLQGNYQEDGARLSTIGCGGRTRDNGPQLKWKMFSLALRKDIFTVRIAKYCSKRLCRHHPCKLSVPNCHKPWATSPHPLFGLLLLWTRG